MCLPMQKTRRHGQHKYFFAILAFLLWLPKSYAPQKMYLSRVFWGAEIGGSRLPKTAPPNSDTETHAGKNLPAASNSVRSILLYLCPYPSVFPAIGFRYLILRIAETIPSQKHLQTNRCCGREYGREVDTETGNRDIYLYIYILCIWYFFKQQTGECRG